MLALGGRAFAQTDSGGLPQPALRIRRDVAKLPANDPNLLALARARQIMLARPDALSWATQVSIHDTYWGQHGTWRFLPWHRCQLYWFERIVARLSGYPDFAMPYWDWQATGKLPPVFTDTRSPFFHPARNRNLAQLDFVRTRATRWSSDWASVFQGSFNSFAGFVGDGGAVESSGHSYVHVMVGGDMGDPATAPNDPLFFFHHCNIDRVWAAWQRRAEQRGLTMDDAWLAEPFDMFVNEDGANAQAFTTQDVLHTETLGYRYDLDYPFAWFDEKPVTSPPGKTRREVVSTTPHSFTLAASPAVEAPLRLPLPSDLIALLAADHDQRFEVRGIGRVRTTAERSAGSVFNLAVERIRKDGTLDSAPVATLLPFVGNHPMPAAMAAMPPAMPGMPTPAAAPVGGPAAPAAMPHEHGFAFNVGPEIYDATGKEAAVEIAVTATAAWVDAEVTTLPPALSGLQIDLVVTEYRWV